MKKNTTIQYAGLIIIMIVAANFLYSPLLAQSYKQEADLLQSVWGLEKQELIKEYMSLSEVEAEAFWPVYEAYANQRKSLGAQRIDIVMDYANNYTSMTNEKAKSITNAVFNNNLKLEKLQKQFYKKLSKAISPLKATEFMQLEKYLDAVMRLELQESLPFLKELEEDRES